MTMMMKAFVAPRAGTQDPLVQMVIPVPEIDDGEVLVRIRAIGVGLHDRWFMPKDVKFPYPIGIEAAGTIERCGGAVTRVSPGDRVMFVSSLQAKGGTWAEFAVVSESALIRLPDALDFVRAAALPVAGGTALKAMHLFDLGSAATVFMAGASGAIGTLAIQLAKAHGARVAASASAGNGDYLRSLGVELAVDYRDPAWIAQVHAWMPGGIDAALAIQPGTADDCMGLLRDGGTIVVVSGDPPAPARGIEITQVVAGPDVGADLGKLAVDVAAQRIRVEVEAVYPFERGVQALEKTETRHARGKVVLTLP